MGFFTDTKFDSSADMLDAIDEVVRRHVQCLRRVTANELGLDMRCGRAYVGENNDCIVVEGDGHMFNYYGGFEYIADEDKRVLGDYVFYLDTSDRVRDALECLMEKDGLCESEDAE
jgi:hypothetical protein